MFSLRYLSRCAALLAPHSPTDLDTLTHKLPHLSTLPAEFEVTHLLAQNSSAQGAEIRQPPPRAHHPGGSGGYSILILTLMLRGCRGPTCQT